MQRVVYGLPTVLSIVSLLGTVGCGYTAGQALYWTGLFKGPKVEAEHTLEDRVLLILVDDPDERVHWPQTMTYLAESLRRQLLDNEVVSNVLAADTIYRLRAAHADFDTRGCREIGRMAGADRVLWLEVRDFYARQEISDVDVAARLAVTVKVIDAGKDKDSAKVRVWPVHPNGRRISADLTAGQVTRAKGVDRIAHLLADQVADKVAKLFYKHTADDFDRSSR
ncbi:MAG: hypothetical protein IH988_10170 [Planctomycetes bacterium]|nr:hypothetical protein [Planctomycetota bacterium]